jgi:hypothetical protein
VREVEGETETESGVQTSGQVSIEGTRSSKGRYFLPWAVLGSDQGHHKPARWVRQVQLLSACPYLPSTPVP